MDKLWRATLEIKTEMDAAISESVRKKKKF